MSLDDAAAKYKEAKGLPKLRDLIAEIGQSYPKFGFFCMFKIMDELVKIYKETKDESLKPLIQKIKAVTEDYKTKFGAKFDEDKDDFMQFVVDYFSSADTEVRNGTASPATIKKLINASNMIDVLTVFGPLSTETNKRKLYAKTMATKLKKNFDETGDVNKGTNALPTANAGNSQSQGQGPTPGNDFKPPQQGYGGENAGNNSYTPGFPSFPAPGQPQPSPKAPVYDSPGNDYSYKPNFTASPDDGIPQEDSIRIQVPKMMANKPATFGSSISSHEKNILDQLMRAPQTGIREPLNQLFKVEVKQVHQNASPGQVSFMNSALYINNRSEFEKKGFEIQDEVKVCQNSLNSDLGLAYQNLVKLKQMMLGILQS